MDEARGDKQKRRKRKTVLAKAKRYGKIGKFGRGSHVEEDTYQYFVRVMEARSHGFETEEDKSG